MDIMTKFGSLLICSLGLLSLTRGQKLSLTPADPSVKKFVNDTYFVSCMPDDGSSNAEWINPRGQRVDSNPQSRVYMEHAIGVDLFIKRITTQDEGKYTCRPTRSRGSTVLFELNVIRPITFDQKDSEQWAEEGKNHLLKCSPKGHKSPMIHWRIDNKQIPGGSTKYKQMKEGLLIHNVTQIDGQRSYVCRATDLSSPLPDSKALNISLKVKMKPKIIGNSRLEHFGVIGDWANLTCRVQAEPKARFEWSFGPRILTPSDTVVIHNEDNASILQVLVRFESNFGTYECRAMNEQGQDVRRLTLRKGRKPAIPKLESVGVTKDSARLKINSVQQGRNDNDDKKHGMTLPITGLIVQYKMVTKSEWLPATFTPHNNFKEFTVSKLTPEVTYNIRAALRNQAAQGEFSSSQFAVKTDLTSASSTSHQNNLFILMGTAIHLMITLAFL